MNLAGKIASLPGPPAPPQRSRLEILADIAAQAPRAQLPQAPVGLAPPGPQPLVGQAAEHATAGLIAQYRRARLQAIARGPAEDSDWDLSDDDG